MFSQHACQNTFVLALCSCLMQEHQLSDAPGIDRVLITPFQSLLAIRPVQQQTL